MSPTYLAPGLYLEEQPAGSRPIQGVGTAVAAFVGLAETGPVGTPTLVTNWTAYRATFGDLAPGCHLPRAVYGYFQNGGGSCYVVRVGQERAEPTPRATLPSGEDPDKPSFEVTAAAGATEPLTVEVSAAGEGDDADAFTLVVRSGDRELERFADLTVAEGAENAVRTVNAGSRLVRLAPAESGALRPAAGSVELTVPEERPARPGPEAYVGDLSLIHI